MKKTLSKLFVLTLGVTALSGCDLFSSGGETIIRGDEEHEVKGLVLKDYSSSVYQGSNYLFEGKDFKEAVETLAQRASIKLPENYSSEYSKEKLPVVSFASLSRSFAPSMAICLTSSLLFLKTCSRWATEVEL